MKKTFATGLAAVLVAGGLGFASAPAQASSAPATSRAALGPLPLDLCDLLPLLCEAPIVGDLLEGVDGALVDLLGTSPTDNPELLLENVEGLVEAVVETLTGVTGPDGQAVAEAIAAQLQGSGLDPAVLTQVLAGLSEAGLPDGSALTDLVNTLVTSVEDLVTGLLGLGGQTPDPAQVQALVDQITAALAAGDPAALQAILGSLLTSLPGGSTLDPSVLTGLVNQLIATLEGVLGGASVPGAIDDVDDALNGGNPAAASATPTLSSPKGYFKTRRPAIRGTGTAGASVTVRTNTGTVLGTGTVSSSGTFVVTSRKLKIGAYRITATQVAPGRSASAKSAGRSFRVVSGTPVIKTKSNAKFTTHRPKIKGIGYPKTRIVLRSSTGKKLGSTTVRSDGTWTIKTKRLTSGKKKVKAVQTGHGKKKTTKVRTIRIR